MPSSPLLDAIREFATTIANPYDVTELLHRVTDHATMVTSACGAGIMLAGRNGLGFAAASDDQVVEVEVTQDRVDDGPCHAAYETGELIAIGDLETAHQWPDYRQRALELGFRAVVGVPMRAWGQVIGVLDIYRRTPGPWSGTDLDAAEIMTSMGAAYVLHAHQMREQHELTDQLQIAVESRDRIGQAKGLLMGRHKVDATQAFEMLRRMSQQNNLKLRDVAAKVIETESVQPA